MYLIFLWVIDVLSLTKGVVKGGELYLEIFPFVHRVLPLLHIYFLFIVNCF